MTTWDVSDGTLHVRVEAETEAQAAEVALQIAPDLKEHPTVTRAAGPIGVGADPEDAEAEGQSLDQGDYP
jgi:hypothetical protein